MDLVVYFILFSKFSTRVRPQLGDMTSQPEAVGMDLVVGFGVGLKVGLELGQPATGRGVASSPSRVVTEKLLFDTGLLFPSRGFAQAGPSGKSLRGGLQSRMNRMKGTSTE